MVTKSIDTNFRKIRSKADAAGNDWITDKNAPTAFCEMVDDLMNYLNTLKPQTQEITERKERPMRPERE